MAANIFRDLFARSKPHVTDKNIILYTRAIFTRRHALVLLWISLFDNVLNTSIHYVVLWWHKFFKVFVKAIIFSCVRMAHGFSHQMSNNKNNINKKNTLFHTIKAKLINAIVYLLYNSRPIIEVMLTKLSHSPLSIALFFFHPFPGRRWFLLSLKRDGNSFSSKLDF